MTENRLNQITYVVNDPHQIQVTEDLASEPGNRWPFSVRIGEVTLLMTPDTFDALAYTMETKLRALDRRRSV